MTYRLASNMTMQAGNVSTRNPGRVPEARCRSQAVNVQTVKANPKTTIRIIHRSAIIVGSDGAPAISGCANLRPSADGADRRREVTDGAVTPGASPGSRTFTVRSE